MVSAPAIAPVPPRPRRGLRCAEVSLLTWNVNQWPSLLSGRSNGRRLARVRAALAGFDVVCLQECWSAMAREIRHAFPQHYVDGGRSAFGFGSGLVTLSRFPIEGGTFRSYESAAAPDAWAAKGVVVVRLEVPGFGPLHVVNTHLQAWRGGGIRVQQIRELERFVRSHSAGVPTLLAGDLNAPPGSPELDLLRQALGYRDVLAERPLETVSPDGGRRFTGAEGRIDHLLMLPAGTEAAVRETGTVDEVPEGGSPASDHTGLFARVLLERWA